MADLPKKVQDEIHKTIKDLSLREFYKGIATGKVTIAKMIIAKLDNVDLNSTTDELLAKIYDVIRFCEITSTITPEIEMSIIKQDNK